jgi:hypothetical protein
MIKTLARDGFLSLHETYDNEGYYYYIMDKKKDDVFRQRLLGAMAGMLPIQKDGTYHNKYEGKYKIKGGRVYNHADDSFEQFLYDRGIPVCMTSETPMKACFKARVMGAVIAVEQFLTYYSMDDKDWAGHGLEF